MQIFYGILVLVVSCLVVCSDAQRVGIRPNCTSLPVCNGTATNRSVICTTNGQSCRIFNSECELQRENCNRTLATGWNRTISIQCTNLRSNQTSGLCACTSQQFLTGDCSNQTVTTGICAHDGFGHRCHLFRTECDLRRARCRGQNWNLLDNRQCRGFLFNQNNTCICPKLLECSRNSTQQCVRVGANNCRLFANECDVELLRCSGERLVDVDMTQCRGLIVGRLGNCSCPALMQCQRNITNICVRNADGRCHLMGNECEMEQSRCRGSDLTRVNAIQCESLRPNATGICSCPALSTCSQNRTNICVQTPTGCELKRNECELEISRCQRQEFRNSSSLQCLGFQPGDRRACTCPNLRTCSRNNTNVCVRTSRGCMLLQNECQYEEERCRGANLALVDGIHCQGLSTLNQLRNCSCPNFEGCSNSSLNVCASADSNQCLLLRNQCDLERQICLGRNLTVVNSLHCQNFTLNTARNCSCPNLQNCDRNSGSTCARQPNNQCTLLANSCDLERAKCEGRNLTSVHPIQCQTFATNQTDICRCPALQTCSLQRTNICVKLRTGCKLKANECELELSRCQGQELSETSALRCLGFQPGESRACTCPSLKTCSRNTTNICARTSQGCLLLQNQCQFEEEKCRGRNLTLVDKVQCLGQTAYNQLRNCSCPNLGQCSESSPNICVSSSSNQCLLLRNRCELEKLKCEGRNLTVINSLHCQNFIVNSPRNCSCPNLLNCNRNSTSVCVRGENRRCFLFRNNCELEQAKCEGRNLSVVHDIQCRSLRPNEAGLCQCTALDNCSRNRTNICIQTPTSCELKRNECDLELSRCQGQVFRITSELQCLRFQPGERNSCTCPNLKTCSRNNTNICVRTPEGCILLENECSVEEERCRGRNLTILNSLHCKHFTVNLLRNCSCPNLLSCNRNSESLCVRHQNNRCQLLSNNCEFERAKCQGLNLTITNPIQCGTLGPNEIGQCSCPALQTCSLNRTNICVERGTGCELKPNECDMELSICQGRDLRITSSLNCLRFHAGERKPCTCPNLRTCSLNSTRICTRTQQGCILYENQCNVEEEKCRGRNLTLVDGLHCREGFSFNQLGNCYCPNLIGCRETQRNICVAVSQSQCRLLRNQCELERAQCEGNNWTVISPLHCQNITVSTTGTCSCPGLRNCNRNSSRICVRQQDNRCQLMENNCELERAKCEGRNITTVSSLNCQNFTIGGNPQLCSCPNLFNCSSIPKRICIESNNTCKLLRNDCELEQEKCQRNDVKILHPLQCSNFAFGQQRDCTCPSLRTCNRNNTSICVKTQSGCNLLRNECELEELKCRGQNVTVIPNNQCQQLRVGVNGTCWCPNLLSCHRNSSQICTESPQGCRLLKNSCELEEMKCQGHNISATNILFCQSFHTNELQPCACPLWRNCSRNNQRNICVQGQRGCMLMADTCEFEKSRCQGKKWTVQNPLQCQNFAVGYIGHCICPRLNTCSRRSNRNICFQNKSLCKYMRNQCEIETSRCKGEGFIPTLPHRCQGIRVGQTSMCRCPEMRRCNSRHVVCGNNGNQCKLFRNDCELKRAICQGERWFNSPLETCCPLQVNEMKNCSLNSESAICGRTSNQQCRLFTSQCEFDAVNAKSRNRFTAVDRSLCKCVSAAKRTGRCNQRPSCSPAERRTIQICARFDRIYRRFTTLCQLKQYNYRSCREFQIVQAALCLRIPYT